MRRSTKASQPMVQSINDQNYKFRCMQYMNFVLDQIMSDDTKFKIYFSHIENLLRNNLNDLTIQDIQKIKRMLEEGQKIKPDLQQTGEFINYDLIEKQKYTLRSTHFYLEQAPSQALLYLQGCNPYTMEQVQLSKLENRIEKLQERNYSLLDMMFKLPEEQYENQLQKQFEFKIVPLEGENQQFQFIKFDNQKPLLEPLPQHPQNPQALDPKTVDEKIVTGQIHEKQKNLQQMKQQKRSLVVTPQKPQQSIADQPVEVQFVQIKKKVKKKKSQNPSAEKPINTNPEPSPNLTAQKPQTPQGNHQVKKSPQVIIEPSQLQNLEQKESLDKKDEPEQKGNSQNNQKRKYVRKKPLEPKPPKPEKQKPTKENKKTKEKSEDNKVQMIQLQKIQSGIELALLNQAAELTNLLGADLLAIRANEKQKEKSPQEIVAIRDLIKKESKSKKQKKKPESQQRQKAESKNSKKNSTKELQIMLPYPNCEQEVQQLQIQIQKIKRNLHQVNIQFGHNMDQANQAINVLVAMKPETSHVEKVQNTTPIVEALIVEEPKVTQPVEQKPEENLVPIETQRIYMTPQQLVEQIQQTAIRQALNEQPKKIKPTPKQSSKKNHPSSEQYKPAEYEISQSQQIGDSKEGDYYQPGKDKKIKKKPFNKKKVKKESSKTDQDKIKSKSVEKIQKISQEPAGKPSQSLISVDTESKEKRVKLTPEQKEKLKLQRQKLKEMRQRDKEEKLKLKELEKLQKEKLKLKKVEKSQKSSKSDKQSEKHRHNSISQVNESSSLPFVSLEQKKQVNILQFNHTQGSRQLQHVQILINEQAHKKDPLNISNGNSSTREDVSLSFVSLVGIQKSLAEEFIIQAHLPVIQESQKPQIDKFEEIQMNEQYLRDQQPVIEGIAASGSFSAFFEEHIANWDESAKHNEPHLSVSPKRQKSHGQINSAEKVQIEKVATKKIKLTCKQSYIFEDPQYGIKEPLQEKQMYTIQVFERWSREKQNCDLPSEEQRQSNPEKAEKNSHQIDQQQNRIEKEKEKTQNRFQEEQIEENSSSLSVKDD